MSNAAQVPDVQESTKKHNIILKCKPVSALIPEPIPIIDLTGLDDSDTEAEDVKNMQHADETKQRNEEEKQESTDTTNTGGEIAQKEKKDENRQNQEGEYHVQEFRQEKETAEGEEALRETENFDRRPSLEDSEDEYDKLDLKYEDVYSDIESEHD